MRFIYQLNVWLRGFFRSSRLDREFNEELRFHFDRQVQANLERGMSMDEARRRARIAIGNPEPIREASRDGRAGAWVRQLGRDLMYGLRLLRKAPAFSITSIAIIALGIASVTMIFSVVYGVALKPLPYREPDRLVNIWTDAPAYNQPRIQVNAADHREWVAANTVFEQIALYRDVANFNLIGAGEPERLSGARVSSNLFPVLGITAAIGRTFTEDEDEIGHDQEALLSDGLWRSRFGADPSIVGRTINLSGMPYVVVGVMRPDFQFPNRDFQIWVPLTINPAELARTLTGFNFKAVARMKPGVTVQQARAEMKTIAKQLEAAHPATNKGVGVDLARMHEDIVGPVAPALWLMLGAVLSLLLVACFNLSNLMSSRAATRSRELAVRLALGAGRGRVALQAIAEVIPLLAIGGALGVAIAIWAVNAFIPFAPATLPRVETIVVNGPVLAVSILALAITGVLASVLPASQAWRSDLTGATRDESRSVAGSRRHARTRSILVAAQVALAMPLLVGAVLLARSFSNISSIDPGFNSDRVLTMLLAIPRSKYTDDGKVGDVTDRIVKQVAAIPQVESAGAVSRLPLNGSGAIGSTVFDSPLFAGLPTTMHDWRSATPAYFRTLGIPIIEGRAFDDRDTMSAKPVGIIDDRLAKLLWPGESAVGKRFRIPFEGMPWVEIIGVVGHIKHDGLDDDRRPQVYWNHLQRAQDRQALVVKPKPGAALTAAEVINAIHIVDPEQPVYDVRPMEQVVQSSLAGRWLNTTLLAAFALMSLLLSCIGVYGVVAFGVTQQTREFGVRLALGASRKGIAAFVLRRGFAMAAGGSVFGLVLAALLARAMSGMLFGVPAIDVASFTLATGVLLLVALAASYFPARRAAMVDPAVTLRGD